MKTIITACVATLILAGTTFAGTGGPKSAPSGGTTASSHRDTKNLGSGTMTPGGRTAGSYRNGENLGNKGPGHVYEGRNHFHWTESRWSSRFGCYTYFCPSTSCYYYWSEPTQCYYPVSYADVVTPTRSEQRLNINVNNSNNNNNSNTVTSGVR